MRVISLTQPPHQYSCRSYLVLGEWGSIEDVNSLIDPGPDGYVINQIEQTYTGVGKKPVDLVVLTHNHFDHAAGAKAIKEKFGAKIAAFLPGPEVDICLKDSEQIRLGGSIFEIIHVPVHSEDSICLYCQDKETLFSGDTSLRVVSSEGSYSNIYLEFLQRMLRVPLKRIYSGHDPLIEENIKSMIEYSIAMIKKSKSIKEAN